MAIYQTLKREEFLKFLAEQKILYARTKTKQLEVTFDNNIIIKIKNADEKWYQGTIAWEGQQVAEAITFYNELP